MYDMGVFAALATAVEELDLPLDGAALREVVSLHDRLDAKVAVAVGGFDRAQLWDLDAAVSMLAWLKQHARMTGPAAARLVKRGRLVTVSDAVAQAWLDGRLSTGQVDVIVANVPEKHVALFVEQEDEIVKTIASLSTKDAQIVMAHWRNCADALADGPDDGSDASSVHLSKVADRHELSGSFNSTDGHTIAAALSLAETKDADGESRTPAQRRADAMVAIHQHFLDHQTDLPGTPRRRPHVNVVVHTDPDGQVEHACYLDDGDPVRREALGRFLCDGAITRVLTDGKSTILDVGTATRVVSVALRLAIAIRDQHCRFPGCDRPPSWCEAHHVIPWEVGGPTNQHNLVLLCSRHHHLIHKPGWQQQLLPDGEYVITTIDGREFRSHPPAHAPPLLVAA